MKTIPPPCPEPESGRTYWRSLDELSQTPEFQQWVEREFPAGASELKDPISRRHFVRIMSSSFLLAGFGLTGCRKPEEKIYPFAKAPDHYVHGQNQYFATAMPGRNAALPLLVKSHEGRPIKVEGNPDCPGHNGGTDPFAQASILDLYDPDRAMRIRRAGHEVLRESAFDSLAQLSRQLAAAKGKGLWFLLEESSSPSRQRVEGLLRQKFPEARWVMYEPVDLAPAFADKRPPRFYELEKAKVIVSLDSDFIGSEEGTWRNIHGFTAGRRLAKPGDPSNRLYIVEALFTLTGLNADHRLRRPATQLPALAARLALEVLGAGGQAGAIDGTLRQGLETIASSDAADSGWVKECAKDLLANRGASVVMAGHRQPAVVHAIARMLNDALGNGGKTVFYPEVTREKGQTLQELHASLTKGEVETLVIVGSNPVYNAPADFEWARSQRRAKTIVRLGSYEDETAELSDWHFPSAHYLESWGDGRTVDGTVVAIQPLVEPLFGGLNPLEFLARLGGLEMTSPHEIVRETFKGLAKEGDFEANWRKFLHSGFWEGTRWPPGPAAPGDRSDFVTTISQATPARGGNRNQLEAIFYRDYSLDDGRYNNNGWLQEFPDPVTKITWDNAVMISRKTAKELDLKNYEVVEVEADGRKVKGPIWVQPGMADYTLGLALGYGRPKSGRVGQGSGFNAYTLRTSTSPHLVVSVKVRKTGERYPLACTQDHWSMEGRPIIREANYDEYQKRPDFARGMDMEKPPVEQSLYPNPFDEIKKIGIHQWGMSIDLTACVGCSACMLACQSENNIPIVGKGQVARGREMHWIRLDRYYTGDPVVEKGSKRPTAPESAQQHEPWIDEPQAVTQPMLCQHCESAPCENVCPVNATVHDEEGLNVMVYNRCVGTRYCSNNCPYKVRRFNYFDFNKRPLKHLYRGPLARRPDDELELVELARNPDVTVRMRGVMEKCTYCTQRIEQAKIAQKVKAGASGEVEVPDGTFQTACQQACPAQAIVFGNIADPNSQVSKAKAQPRTYQVLEFLLTKPRTTYLARVRNPNPLMPDYRKSPLSSQEYQEKSGQPNGHGPGHAPAGTPGRKEAGHG